MIRSIYDKVKITVRRIKNIDIIQKEPDWYRLLPPLLLKVATG